jgi:drug/metabolite transporter (DMT)-like permease
MRWQVLILLNALLYGFATILMRTQMLSKKCRDAPYALNCVTYLALMLVAILGVHHFGHVHLSVFRRYYWRFILGGSAFAMSNITIYKLLMRVDAAIASILTTLNAIVTLGLAALLLNEHVTLLQAFGCIILLGATLYGVAATHASRKHRTKGVIPYIALYTVLTAILYGLAATNEKYLLSHVSIGS